MTTQDPGITLQGGAIIAGVHDVFLGNSGRPDIRQAALNYFQRTVQGHREALHNLDETDFESAYINAALIMYVAFFLHVGGIGDDLLESADERLWFSLGGATRWLILEGERRTGCNVTYLSGLIYEHPDLSDNSIFDPAHRRPFEVLLSWGLEYEHQEPDDQEAYEDTVSYLGLMYTSIVDRSDSALATSRRILAAPTCLPIRFCEMIIEQRPRALAILAQFYAIAKLIAADIPWFVEIAERQVPSIRDRLPRAWSAALTWPLAILACDRTSGLPFPEPSQTIGELPASEHVLQ